MRPIRARPTPLKNAIVVALDSGGGRLDAIRLRMTVEATLGRVPESTWAEALARLEHEGLIGDAYASATSADIAKLQRLAADPDGRLAAEDEPVITLTASGRTYAPAVALLALVDRRRRPAAEKAVARSYAAAITSRQLAAG